MATMALDFQHPPIWLAKLDVVRAELECETRPASAAEGILATCRLSDDLRTFTLACLRAQHPSLSPSELEALFAQQRDDWMRQRLRFFPPYPGDSRDGTQRRLDPLRQP